MKLRFDLILGGLAALLVVAHVVIGFFLMLGSRRRAGDRAELKRAALRLVKK